MNNKEFSDIYRYTKTKIYCTDNGVRNEIKWNTSKKTKNNS
jgi:hypothetical protein